ncbi:FliI/YscN family ATPase [Pseudomonas sp. LRF_L74]|uniref:FliI/YscN family ATPase n=1 Tax=Pseudomonas sp. LRF_L74 TaxID=3369422 RepID=UPI003F61F573
MSRGMFLSQLEDLMPRLRERAETAQSRQEHGRVRRVSGVMVHASVPMARIGELCHLRDPLSGRSVPAEVVGFADDDALLTPIGDLQGISTRCEVLTTGSVLSVPIGEALLGMTIDPLGHVLDGTAEQRALLASLPRYPVHREPPAAFSRQLIEEPMQLGIRAIDGLLTIARGQRVGLFGEPGAGKSSLLSSMVKGSDAEVIVLALIGERGREVRELLERHLDPAARKRTVTVVATSDRPAMERVKAAYVATSVAEYFRDQGCQVLLLMDSVTRFARAQREIGLAAGEPATRRGFPPSLFAELPRLLERAGPGEQGTITGLYTVLTEGDGSFDPVAEEVMSILDGHILLSARLAQRNHFPAIDVLRSRSRLMDTVTPPRQRQSAGQLRDALARYEEVELLLQVGEYSKGNDAETDAAIARHAALQRFLRQGPDERSSMSETLQAMLEIMQ